MNEKIAVFPGSFDPISVGHKSIITRAVPLFDKIIVAIGRNAQKKEFFSIEKRLCWIRKVFKDYPCIEVDQFSGLTVDYCREKGAKYILRGLRTSADFEFERSVGQVNKMLYTKIETVFLLTKPEHTALNSSVIRDIIRHKGDVRGFVPEEIDGQELMEK
ncbi:MAG: pantetheine-phosphate adenylyltransferase [Bacteroidales bacterium]